MKWGILATGTIAKKVFIYVSSFFISIPSCRSPYAIVSARKKALCGMVCAYTSPANFMPQLMRVSYIRRVRARLSCGV